MNLIAPLAYLSAGICGMISAVYFILTLTGKRRSIARWSFSISIALLGLESLVTGFSAAATHADHFLFWQQIRLVVLSFLPGTWILFSLTYARGSTRKFLHSWRYLLIVAFALPALLATFYSDSYILFRQLQGDGSITVLLGWPGQAINFLIILGSVLSMMNLERTYRAAVGAMRWQVKYMLLGLGTLFLVRFYTSSQALLFANVHSGMDTLNSIGLIVSSLLIIRALSRRGHFDVELYPSHAVLSNSLTILLAGIYLLAVGVLAKIVALIGGDISFPLKAFGVLIALVLLATLLQSDHLRLNIKQFISRHFKRPMHDYRTVWMRFTEESSSHVRQPDLCDGLAKLIAETFDSHSVNLWLLGSGQTKITLAASTVITDKTSPVLDLLHEEIKALKSQFSNLRRPIDLDKAKADWARKLRESNPKKFPHGGDRICVPMTTRESILGVIVIGDRVSGIPFTEPEFDILISVGTHAASSLLNLQLSEKIIVTRELEAFQTMATFFVHDLKNAASTLNIMVKNLPIHWDNPEFRDDALRGISKTGDRINDIIGRLSTVRSEIAVDLKPLEMGVFAKQAIEIWQAPENTELVTRFESRAVARIDKEQLSKVLLNLVINSSEAIEGVGRIEASISVNEKYVFLKVRDNGCGMSQEFVNKNLFRPFQTTKKHGLGIGMFQSKMIVEAHGGRIIVESEAGKGTTFRVALPLEQS
ncbi:MAG: PEP-CTERM system histidine kinase PrsK [Porticoccaceae bacterium]|nr:PEP-CTERM system histidine kinase PrsK [Porticoccaceae bacterium]